MLGREAEKLKILFLTSDKFPPFRPAARALFTEEFAARGHRVDWVLQAERGQPRPAVVRWSKGVACVGATDEGATRWRRLRKHLLDLRNDLRAIGLLRRGNYDLLQVKDLYLSAWLLAWVAKRRGIPFFYWLAYPHGEASLYAARSGTARYRIAYALRGWLFCRLLYRHILPKAHHIFVQSEQMRRDVGRQGIPLEAMTAVPGSLNLAQVPYPQGPGQGIAKPLGEEWLLYVGTLIRERRLDFLIRVLQRVREARPGARLLFVGKGEMAEDEERLRAEARRCGLEEAVIFTGYLPMGEAWEYIRAADVCLSPYYPVPILNSTSPTKLIEYMAMARPVVGNDHPEQSEVLASSGAGLTAPWEEESFARAVLAILNNPALGSEMGRRGRAFVETYRTNRAMADRVLKRYIATTGSSSTGALLGQTEA